MSLADELSHRILNVEQWLKEQANSDARVLRLLTHPGVGLLTSLCLVHTLGDLSRFPSTRKVAAYVGFDPMEDSSAERKSTGASVKPARDYCVTCWWRRARQQLKMMNS